MEVISFFVFIGLIWFICQYHWLRIIACGLLLAVWGSVAIVAPAVLAFMSFGNGEPIVAIMQLALGGLLGFFWWIAGSAAYNWVQWQIKHDCFWLPWNAE